MSKLGFSVMIRNFFGDNSATVASLEASLGKTLRLAELKDDTLRLHFTDGTGIAFSDAGQSCCERRYMRTDDALSEFTGAKFLGAELRDGGHAEPGPDEDEYYGDVHEIQFLVIQTSLGNITMSSHNEHNGYYGGFAIEISQIPVGEVS